MYEFKHIHENPFSHFERSEYFNTAIRLATKFHKKYYHSEVDQKIKDEDYNNLAWYVKQALEYLCCIGEID